MIIVESGKVINVLGPRGSGTTELFDAFKSHFGHYARTIQISALLSMKRRSDPKFEVDYGRKIDDGIALPDAVIGSLVDDALGSCKDFRLLITEGFSATAGHLDHIKGAGLLKSGLSATIILNAPRCVCAERELAGRTLTAREMRFFRVNILQDGAVFEKNLLAVENFLADQRTTLIQRNTALNRGGVMQIKDIEREVFPSVMHERFLRKIQREFGAWQKSNETTAETSQERVREPSNIEGSLSLVTA